MVSALIEAEIKEEIEKAKGNLSWGEFIERLWLAHKGELTPALHAENLERENAELRRRVQELEELVSKLQERLGTTTARERDAKALMDDIEKALPQGETLKVLDFVRRLGWSEEGEALIKKATAFRNRWFRLDGGVFVSKELGLVIEPRPGVGILGWKVRRWEHE